MTPQDWKQVEADLSTPYGHVRLSADGHEIVLSVERVTGLRYAIGVFIDGYIRWGRCSRPEPDAIERKFWRLKRTFLYSAKKRTEFAEQAKKRGMPAELKAHYKRMAEALYETLDPTWPNAKALCRHLQKSCSKIERMPNLRTGAEIRPAESLEHTK